MNGMGIEGRAAPELAGDLWRGPDGEELATLGLQDLPGRFKLLFFFQSWCPGCHSQGFPSLARILEGTDRTDLGAVAVQTVFEGFEANTPEKAWALQQEHGLGIPFGHDGIGGRSPLMAAYRSGGTPWLVLVGPDGNVLANHFHFDADAVIEAIRSAA